MRLKKFTAALLAAVAIYTAAPVSAWTLEEQLPSFSFSFTDREQTAELLAHFSAFTGIVWLLFGEAVSFIWESGGVDGSFLDFLEELLPFLEKDYHFDKEAPGTFSL